jgi:hypothetical protein
MSLFVNMWKAAEHMVARLVGEGGKLILSLIYVISLTCSVVPEVPAPLPPHHVVSQCEGYGEGEIKDSVGVSVYMPTLYVSYDVYKPHIHSRFPFK